MENLNGKTNPLLEYENNDSFEISKDKGKGKGKGKGKDTVPVDKEVKKVPGEKKQLQLSKGKGGAVSSEKMIKSISGVIYKKIKREEKTKLDADAIKLDTKINNVDSTKKDLVDNDRKIYVLLEELKKCRTNRIHWEIKLTEQEKDLQLCKKQQRHNDYKLTNDEFMFIQCAVKSKDISKGIIYRGFKITDKILSLGRSVKRKGVEYGLCDLTICIDNYEGTLYFFKIVDNIWKYDSYLTLSNENIKKRMSERTECLSLDKEFNYDLTEYEVPQIYVNKSRKSSFIEDW